MKSRIVERTKNLITQLEKHFAKLKVATDQPISASEDNEGDKLDYSRISVENYYAFDNIRLISQHYWQMWEENAPQWASDWYGGPQPHYTIYPIADILRNILGLKLTEEQIHCYRSRARCYFGTYTEGPLFREDNKHQVFVRAIHSENNTGLCLEKTFGDLKISICANFDSKGERIVSFTLYESAYSVGSYIMSQSIVLDIDGYPSSQYRAWHPEMQLPRRDQYPTLSLMKAILTSPVTIPIDWSIL